MFGIQNEKYKIILNGHIHNKIESYIYQLGKNRAGNYQNKLINNINNVDKLLELILRTKKPPIFVKFAVGADGFEL